MKKQEHSRICTAFGKAIRQARVIRGLSQEKLAEFSDLNRTYIGDIERGKRNVSLVNMQKIATALGLKLSDLILSYEKTNVT